MTDVYRAPLRSRRDDIDPAATRTRALSLGLCGFGGVLDPAPHDVESAVLLASRQHDVRLARRIDRFAAVDPGSLVWTRDNDVFWLGRIDGPWRYDGDERAAAVDLVHVRACTWLSQPITESGTPAAVVATFNRGGRNFQRIHGPAVAAQSRQLWDCRHPHAERRPTPGPS